MSRELEPVEADDAQQLVVPGTGEVFTITTPELHGKLLTGDVAKALEAIDRLRAVIDERRRQLVELLGDVSDRIGTQTLHFEDGRTVKVWGGPEGRTETDAEELRARLLALGLPADRVDEAVPMVVTYKPNGNVLRQLKGANSDYARAIDESTTKVAAKRGAGIA